MVAHPGQCDPMTLRRHASHYLAIGFVQWLLDWGVMVGLSHFGMRVVPANIVGRIAGACVGYWLNGKLTFAGDDTTVGHKQFGRFLAMWVFTTALSTLAMGHIDDVFGLKWAWIAKPAIELVLGLIGFVLSRHWVYKA